MAEIYSFIRSWPVAERGGRYVKALRARSNSPVGYKPTVPFDGTYGGGVLPEQILRSTDMARVELAQGNIPWSSISRVLALFTASARLIAQDTQPHTLTGDEWYAAIAKADAQTDEALDAVY